MESEKLKTACTFLLIDAVKLGSKIPSFKGDTRLTQIYIESGR